MMQVEAVVKMLQPGFNVASIAAKRRNKSNPWFKRGTLFRRAVGRARRAGTPMTARELPTRWWPTKPLRPRSSKRWTYRPLSLLRCGGGTAQWWLVKARPAR
jgi:hypothetical protein